MKNFQKVFGEKLFEKFLVKNFLKNFW